MNQTYNKTSSLSFVSDRGSGSDSDSGAKCFGSFFRSKKFLKLRSILTFSLYSQFFYYGIVGFISTLADGFLLYLLEKLGMNYLLSSLFSFLVGLATNYILAKSFIFNKNKSIFKLPTEIFFYSLIGTVGLILTLSIMYIFTQIVGLYFMISKLIAIFIVLFFNFTAKRFLLFR